MFKSLTLVALFMVCASAQAEQVIYRKANTEFTVKLVFADQDTTRTKCASIGAWGGYPPRGRGSYGCVAYSKATNTATIYATQPKEVDDAATLTLGHELLHVYAGEYHDHE